MKVARRSVIFVLGLLAVACERKVANYPVPANAAATPTDVRTSRSIRNGSVGARREPVWCEFLRLSHPRALPTINLVSSET